MAVVAPLPGEGDEAPRERAGEPLFVERRFPRVGWRPLRASGESSQAESSGVTGAVGTRRREEVASERAVRGAGLKREEADSILLKYS